jgi:hypothetical protein
MIDDPLKTVGRFIRGLAHDWNHDVRAFGKDVQLGRVFDRFAVLPYVKGPRRVDLLRMMRSAVSSVARTAFVVSVPATRVDRTSSLRAPISPVRSSNPCISCESSALRSLSSISGSDWTIRSDASPTSEIRSTRARRDCVSGMAANWSVNRSACMSSRFGTC